MITRLAGFFNRETSSITVAALLLAAASFAADLLGLVRDRILASQFGAGEVLDIYYAGFRIPDLLLNILILGAMSSAFLPVFAERYARDPKDAWRLATNILTFAAIALLACALFLFFAIPWLMPLIVPGFPEEALARAVTVTRILLLSPILFGISSVISVVLHYFQRFLLYSFAPILYNIGIIIGALAFAPRYLEVGLAFGVLLGAAMHLGVQFPGAVAAGLPFRVSLRPIHAAVSEVVRLAVPRTGNLVVNQLQFTALTAVASVFAAGSIAVFNFGMNLAFVPIGVIGVSFATAAFPALSRAYAAGEREGFARTLRQTTQEVLFFALPAAVLFLVLRAHIVRVVLGAGAFTWEDTRLTAAALGAFAFGVVALSLLPLFVRAFFARKDTTTPFLAALGSSVATVAAAVWLGAQLGTSAAAQRLFGSVFRVEDLADIRVLALPVAIAVTATAQVAVLFLALHRRVLRGETRVLLRAAVRLSAAASVAGIVAWAALRLLAQGVAQETFVGIFLQGAVAGLLGVLAYLVLAFVFAFPEARRVFAILRNAFPPLNAIFARIEGSEASVLPKEEGVIDEQGRATAHGADRGDPNRER